jgi:hypothetical protein
LLIFEFIDGGDLFAGVLDSMCAGTQVFQFKVIMFDAGIARLASMATAIDCNSGYAGYANFGGLLRLPKPEVDHRKWIVNICSLFYYLPCLGDQTGRKHG